MTERKRNAHMRAYTSHTHHIHMYPHAHASKPHTPLTHTHLSHTHTHTHLLRWGDDPGLCGWAHTVKRVLKSERETGKSEKKMGQGKQRSKQ